MAENSSFSAFAALTVFHGMSQWSYWLLFEVMCVELLYISRIVSISLWTEVIAANLC